MYPFPVSPQTVTPGVSDRDLPSRLSSTSSRDASAFAHVFDETVRETARDDRPAPPESRSGRDDRADKTDTRPTRDDNSRAAPREDNPASQRTDRPDRAADTSNVDSGPDEMPPVQDTEATGTDASDDGTAKIEPETVAAELKETVVATATDLTAAPQIAETTLEAGTQTILVQAPNPIAAEPSIAISETGEAVPSNAENPMPAKAGVETAFSTATTVGAGQAQITANPATGEDNSIPQPATMLPVPPANSGDPLTATTAPLPAAAQAAAQPKRTGATAAEPQIASDGAGQATDADAAATGEGEPAFGFKEKTGPMGTAPTATGAAPATAAAGQQAAGALSPENPDTVRPIDAARSLAARADTSGAATADLRATPSSATATQSVSSATSFANELRAAADIASGAANTAARTGAQPAVQQIAVQISRAAEAGQDRLTVNLKPAELGNVTIKLEVGHDHRIIAVIQAERPETLELLQRDARSLERAMADAGLNTDSGSLNFGLKDSGAEFMADDQNGKGQTAGLSVPDIEIDDATPTLYAPMADGSGVNINV